MKKKEVKPQHNNNSDSILNLIQMIIDAQSSARKGENNSPVEPDFSDEKILELLLYSDNMDLGTLENIKK